MGTRGDVERDERREMGGYEAETDRYDGDPAPTAAKPRRRKGLPSTCRNINTEIRPGGRIVHPYCGGTLRNGYCQWHPELGDQWEGLR